jgi:hypothetical protein
MKRILILLLPLVSVFCVRADTLPCPNGIKKIINCPEEGCGDHDFDPELNKRKNIRADDQQQPTPRSIQWIKDLPNPTNFVENGSRDELKQLGEGQKITVVAWALTARMEDPETCNCQLPHLYGDESAGVELSSRDHHARRYHDDLRPTKVTQDAVRIKPQKLLFNNQSIKSKALILLL